MELFVYFDKVSTLKKGSMSFLSFACLVNEWLLLRFIKDRRETHAFPARQSWETRRQELTNKEIVWSLWTSVQCVILSFNFVSGDQSQGRHVNLHRKEVNKPIEKNCLRYVIVQETISFEILWIAKLRDILLTNWSFFSTNLYIFTYMCTFSCIYIFQ